MKVISNAFWLSISRIGADVLSFVLFAVINWVGYFIALIAGVLVGAASVIALKSMNREPADDLATV